MTVKSLHLIPVGLGNLNINFWLPSEAIKIVKNIDLFIAENAKTARAFLKLIEPEKPIQEIKIFTLTDESNEKDFKNWFSTECNNGIIGLVSEAGCPAVADPGAKVVAYAHKSGLDVIPWTGPSSILLGLMGSGLDGQRFTFHGYAPIDIATKNKLLRIGKALQKTIPNPNFY